MEIEIRKATIKDIPAIFNLVRDLAIFEKEEDKVTATLEDYLRDFKDEKWDSIVALHDDQIVGMGIIFDTYSTWKGRMLWLEDFIVKEDYRRAGIGQRLFDALLDEAKQRGAKLMKWQVLDWNEGALRFYEKNKAIIEKDWWNGKILLSK